MIDNSEVNRILNKLENLEDENMAVELLREFNNKTKVLGNLLMNLDKGLSHEEWKVECDLAKKDVDLIIAKIDQF